MASKGIQNNQRMTACHQKIKCSNMYIWCYYLWVLEARALNGICTLYEIHECKYRVLLIHGHRVTDLFRVGMNLKWLKIVLGCICLTAIYIHTLYTQKRLMDINSVRSIQSELAITEYFVGNGSKCICTVDRWWDVIIKQPSRILLCTYMHPTRIRPCGGQKKIDQRSIYFLYAKLCT